MSASARIILKRMLKRNLKDNEQCKEKDGLKENEGCKKIQNTLNRLG